MFRFNLLRSSSNNISIRTAEHIKARALPIMEQLKSVGVKQSDVDAASTKNGLVSARAASSLLQDWVMLAHRRPIHTASDIDPSFNVSSKVWSDEECAMISKTIQLRDFDPKTTASSKMNFAKMSSSVRDDHENVSTSSPRIIPRTVIESSTEEKFTSSSTSKNIGPVEAEVDEAAVPPSPTSSSTPRLKPRIVVRQSRRSSSSTSPQKEIPRSSDDHASNHDVDKLNEEQHENTSSNGTSSSSGATPRRRVVRVGTAGR